MRVVVHSAHEVAAVAVALDATAERANTAELAVAVQAVDAKVDGRCRRRDVDLVEAVGATHAVRASGGVDLDDQLAVLEVELLIGRDHYPARQSVVADV